MGEFVRVAKLADVPAGGCMRVEIAGDAIGLFNIGGEVFAISDVCTHAEASLCEGDIEGDEVLCPLHFASFNIRTGECTGPPADEDLKTYPIRIRDDMIEVEV